MMKKSQKSDKMELIVKPTQSGKTFVMLQEIPKMLESDNEIVHIIFCDNQLLQTEQTSNRLENYNGLETYRSDNGDLSLILSSKSNIKKYSELTHHICGGLKIIITCSNKKRVNDVDKLIDYFNINGKLNDYKFSIWIDEIDKNISLFKNYLDIWNSHPQVQRIGLITATPDSVLEIYQNVKIFELKKSYNKKIYHSFEESNFELLNYPNTSIKDYVTHVITEFSHLINNGQVWLIPGEVNTTSHYNIKNMLVKKGFIVIVINGDGINMFYGRKSKELINEMNDNLADFLGNLYLRKKLNLQKVAITGNLCINRGITINSEKMLITHAIFPTKISNPCNSYQLAGRICGNIKKFKNYVKPLCFCSELFKNIIIEMELRAKVFAEKAYDENILSNCDLKSSNRQITENDIIKYLTGKT